jgi:ADYC domain-containing protein
MNKTILYIAMSCAACVPASDASLGEDTQDMISLNGISLNGISLNGISLNGTALSGLNLNAVSIIGKAANGTAVTAATGAGQPWTTASYVGSTWTATATQGTTVTLRIDGAAIGTAPNTDLWFYNVSYQSSTGWSPVCGLDASNQPIQAVPVPGVWGVTTNDSAKFGISATQFTLACRTKTIAKCLEMGYKPSKGYTTQLMSCVRLLRGDFCGTGTPGTVDGTTLNLYDNVGVQADTQAWAPEAEWTPAGARCINSNNDARYELVYSRDPRCVRSLKTSTCGTSFASGAILIDELPQNFVASQTQTSSR